MKFKSKELIVEAFQYDGDLMNSKGEYYVPDWAVDAFESKILFYDLIGAFFIRNEDEVQHINVGDYIIKTKNDKIYFCNQDFFNNTYTELRVYPIGYFKF